MILAGRTFGKIAGHWRRFDKPSTSVDDEVALRVERGEEQKFVSRAGLKLEGALRQLAYSPDGRTALDVGQSTGGFTDCLLTYGARRVVGVDVGRGQLAPALRAHPRVECREGINARDLELAQFADIMGNRRFDLIVVDVAFISQTLILPRLAPLLVSGGTLISLVKPQFEVGPAGIGKGGLVKDPSLFADVEQKLRRAAVAAWFVVDAFFDSPLQGGDGNREFFLAAHKN